MTAANSAHSDAGALAFGVADWWCCAPLDVGHLVFAAALGLLVAVMFSRIK